MMRVFITGTAGFVGFHLTQRLLAEGFTVHGYDGMTDYYDVRLKQRRHAILRQHAQFHATEALLQNEAALKAAIEAAVPDVIVHLAAQAGVRYSLVNPRAYIDTNVVGTFNVMECARQHGIQHLLMASTSSVYGANEEMPFSETDKADMPLTIYAATKKANEALVHSYAHLHDLPTTMFRFFTVYGPWGRPDMAYYKFAEAILAGRTIDIYNHGEMWRDFTYVADLVQGIRLLIDAVPLRPFLRTNVVQGDNLSAVAPFRVVNIGNSEKVKLLDFIEAIESELGIKAKRNYVSMQPGDMAATWADTSLLHELTGYQGRTSVRDGIAEFMAWFRDYHGISKGGELLLPHVDTGIRQMVS